MLHVISISADPIKSTDQQMSVRLQLLKLQQTDDTLRLYLYPIKIRIVCFCWPMNVDRPGPKYYLLVKILFVVLKILNILFWGVPICLGLVFYLECFWCPRGISLAWMLGSCFAWVASHTALTILYRYIGGSFRRGEKDPEKTRLMSRLCIVAACVLAHGLLTVSLYVASEQYWSNQAKTRSRDLLLANPANEETRSYFHMGNGFAFPLRGGRQDYEEAERWYRLAADHKYAAAQYRLGHLHYLYGDPVLMNYREAEKWYRLAAEQGYADAGYWLAKVSAHLETANNPDP